MKHIDSSVHELERVYALFKTAAYSFASAVAFGVLAWLRMCGVTRCRVWRGHAQVIAALVEHQHTPCTRRRMFTGELCSYHVSS